MGGELDVLGGEERSVWLSMCSLSSGGERHVARLGAGRCSQCAQGKELGWRCFGRTDAGVGAVSHVGDCLL